MSDPIERPYILHMLTATPQMSPFDVNMAADAGYQVIVPYCNVDGTMVTNLTQDAIFSRGPKGVSRTGIFIGGRDVMLAADMRSYREAQAFEGLVVFDRGIPDVIGYLHLCGLPVSEPARRAAA